MVQIVSLSLNDDIVKQLDKLQHEMGFSGRSEAVRAAIRHFAVEQPKLQGIVNAALLAVHDDEHTQVFTTIRHTYDHIIKTQLHNHLEEHACMEILVVKGDAKDVKKLYNELTTSKKIRNVKLVVL